MLRTREEGRDGGDVCGAKIDCGEWVLMTNGRKLWDQRAGPTLAIVREGPSENDSEEAGDAIVWCHPAEKGSEHLGDAKVLRDNNKLVDGDNKVRRQM